jgi:hypothetical protein
MRSLLRVLPDQELQPTFSSSINIETEEDIRYDNAVVIGCKELADVR